MTTFEMENALISGNQTVFSIYILGFFLVFALISNRALNEIIAMAFRSDSRAWRSAVLRVIELVGSYVSFMSNGLDKRASNAVTFNVLSDIFKNGPVFQGRNKFNIFLKLLIIYSLLSVISIYSTYPVYPDKWPPVPYVYSDGFEVIVLAFILIVTNILTDMVSIAFTYRNIQILERQVNSGLYGDGLVTLFKDTVIAGACFLISQIVSNALYPMPLEESQGVMGPSIATVFSVDTALLPYAFTDGSNVSELVFSGQLFLTGTVFFPTLLLLLLVVFMLAITIATKLIWPLVSLLRTVVLGRGSELPGPSPHPVAVICQTNIARIVSTILLGLVGAYIFQLILERNILPGL